MITDLARVRNIGISAHIDSGKTTLTERILYYTKRIHAIHDVKGKDGVGAKMDSMELERERGITIQSAATHCVWAGHHINIIDTPGHVDFTIEVERSLRVLDGAVLVLCAVAGVQSQSMTVDRQMRRYSVPRIAFVNKCDRSGASPARVTQQLRDKLRHNAVMMQIPIGLEADHAGVVDLVAMKAIHFDGENGEKVRVEKIPDSLLAAAEAKREELLDAVSLFSDELTEAILGGKVTEDLIHAAVRKGDSVTNARTKRRVKVGRLVRMHADEMEDIEDAASGDIVAMFGVDCASGDTFTSESVDIAMTSMHVPEPVISLSIRPKDNKAQGNMGKALQRFTKEDPTFRSWADPESGQTLIAGMGELHLEVYVERMKREYSAEVEVGAPQVAYRETVSQRAEFNYVHKKQTGGAGQFGRVAGYFEPFPEGEFEFVNEIRGGAIPTEFIPSCEKGFRSLLKKGP